MNNFDKYWLTFKILTLPDSALRYSTLSRPFLKRVTPLPGEINVELSAANCDVQLAIEKELKKYAVTE